jgi:hypothetical protein
MNKRVISLLIAWLGWSATALMGLEVTALMLSSLTGN